MIRTTFEDFELNYLPKNGELGDEVVFARSPTVLKQELDYFADIVEILVGEEPAAWDISINYNTDDFVYHNGYTYIALQANIASEPINPGPTADWSLVNISAVGSGSGGSDIERQDFVAVASQTEFITNYELLNPTIFIDGVLVDTGSYVTVGTLLTFNEPLQADAIVTVYVAAAVPSSILIGDTFTATAAQTTFNTSFEFLHEAVYVNGLLQTGTYTVGVSSIIFDSGLTAGDVVVVYSSTAIENYKYEEEVDFDTGAGQTIFTIDYLVGKIKVFKNGVKLRNTEFVATNGTTITIASALEFDWIQVVKILG